jgi:hypothetical protein
MRTFRFLTLLLCVNLLVCASTLADLKDGLVAYYQFEGDLTDASGSGHDAQPAAGGTASFVGGFLGQAVDTREEGVDCGTWDPSDEQTDALSGSCWVYWLGLDGAAANWQGILAKRSGWGAGITRWWIESWSQQATAGLTTHGDDGGGTLGSFTLIPDEWQHIAFGFDGTNGAIYFNGEQVGSGPWSLSPDKDAHLTIGIVQAPSGNLFNGYIDEAAFWNRGLSDEELLEIYNEGQGVSLTGPSQTAGKPSPGNGASDVARDLPLTWKPSSFAATHNLYLSPDLVAVGAGDPAVLVAESLDVNAFTPETVLDFAQTYYWRVDEVNSAPDFTVFPGEIWSFTVEPVSYPIETVTATASSAHGANMSPDRTVGGFGLNAQGQHSVTGTDMWLSAMGDAQPWLQYEFAQAYKLHEMWVWNSNQIIESFIGLGAKDVAVETSLDGVAWSPVENVAPFAQSPGSPDYTADIKVDLGGAYAKFVRLTISSGWGAMPQFGLSEVRFFFIPNSPREPQPLDGTTLDRAEALLAWRAGREAASHQIYLGTDAQALPLTATTTENSYAAGALDYGTTYYWSVTEVNEAETISSYAGDTWSFTTPDFGIVDDFDQYNDDCLRIFFAWEDGLGHNGAADIDNCDVPASSGNGGGSIVGNDQAPFAEKTIVNAGSFQSLPFNYDNAFGQSETSLKVGAQDWTVSGIQTLALAFRGAAGNAGQLYVKINNTKVAYDGDAGDIAVSTWQAWNIDLTALGGLGNVTRLSIGVDGATATGMLYIDDIRLYPLPGEMLTPVDPGNANLVAHYAFEGNAEDSSGNGYHGVENGAPEYQAGIMGQALSLNGFASYVSVDSVGIPAAAPRSIAGWAKANTDAMFDWTNVFGFTGPSTHGQHFDIQIVGNTSNTTAGFFGLHRHGWERDITANDQEWHHLAATFDGGTVSLFGDGLLVGTDSVDNVNTPGPVHMGRRQDNDNYFEGLIDDVRIYDTALTSEEIAWIAGKRTPLHKGL